MGSAGFGTPGETRTHYLALRRRTLYPGELRGHTHLILYRKKWVLSIKTDTFFAALGIYCLVGGDSMWENDDRAADLDDLIFDEDDGGPSER